MSTTLQNTNNDESGNLSNHNNLPTQGSNADVQHKGPVAALASNMANYLQTLSHMESQADDSYANAFSGHLGSIIADRLGNLAWFRTFYDAFAAKILMPRVITALNYVNHKINGLVSKCEFTGFTMFNTGNSSSTDTLSLKFYVPSVSNVINGTNFVKIEQTIRNEITAFDPGFHKMVKRDSQMNYSWIMNKYVTSASCYVSWIKEAWGHAHISKALKKNYISTTMLNAILIDSKNDDDCLKLKFNDPNTTVSGDATCNLSFVFSDNLNSHLTSIEDDSNIFVSKAKSDIELMADFFAIWASRIKEFRVFNECEVKVVFAFLTKREVSSFFQRISLSFNPDLPLHLERLVTYMYKNKHYGSQGLYLTSSLDCARMIDIVAHSKYRYSHSGKWRSLAWLETTTMNIDVPCATWWARLAQAYNIVDYANDDQRVVPDVYQLDDFAWYRGGAIGSLTDIANQIVCGHVANIPSLDSSAAMTRYLNQTLNLLLNMCVRKDYNLQPLLFKYSIHFVDHSSSLSHSADYPIKVNVSDSVVRWTDPDTKDKNGNEWYEKHQANIKPTGDTDLKLSDKLIIMTRADFSATLGEQFGRLLDYGDIFKIDLGNQIGMYGIGFKFNVNDTSLRNLIVHAIARKATTTFTISNREGTTFRNIVRSYQGKNASATYFEIPLMTLAAVTNNVSFSEPVRQIHYTADLILVPGSQGSVQEGNVATSIGSAVSLF